MREPNAVDKYLRINPQTRLFEPVWKYRDILSYWLGADASVALSSSVPGEYALAANSSIVLPYKLQHTSLSADDSVGNPLLVDQIVFNETVAGNTVCDYNVFLNDMGDQRQYMNFPIHVQTFAGSGQLSARLTENLMLPTRHQLNLTLSNNGNTAYNTNLFFIGRLFDTWSTNLQKYPEDRKAMLTEINRLLERRKYVTPYWLTTYGGPVTIPANQSVDIDTPIGSEGHFECSEIMRYFPGGDQTAGAFELEILNPQTRQSLMNGKIHSYMIGNAFNPQPFPAHFIIPAGQTLRFRIKDLSGSANTVYLTLRGMKIRAPFKSRAEVEKDFGKPGKPIQKPNTRHKEMVGA